jgi:1-acyl-sn-glycerol-3-phosphate acyltransferase
MHLLFTLVFWTYLSLSSLALFIGALLLWMATAPFDPLRRLLHRYTCWWAVHYIRLLPGGRCEVTGREKIVPGTAYVLAANHQSMADVMALSALHVPFKWVSKKEVFRLPLVGWNMYLNGYVRVDRGNVRQVARTMQECRDWLKRGMPLLMFPEGHRSPTGELLRFHNGAFKLAVEADVAVVPVVIDGTWRLLSGLMVNPAPGTISIRVLDPIAPKDVGNDADMLRQRTYDQVSAALESMRGGPAA